MSQRVYRTVIVEAKSHLKSFKMVVNNVITLLQAIACVWMSARPL